MLYIHFNQDVRVLRRSPAGRITEVIYVKDELITEQEFRRIFRYSKYYTALPSFDVNGWSVDKRNTFHLFGVRFAEHDAPYEVVDVKKLELIKSINEGE